MRPMRLVGCACEFLAPGQERWKMHINFPIKGEPDQVPFTLRKIGPAFAYLFDGHALI